MGNIDQLREDRNSIIDEATAVVEKAKSEDRDLTVEESEKVDECLSKAESLSTEIAKAEKSAAQISAIEGLRGRAPEVKAVALKSETAKVSNLPMTMGEHFVKSAGDRLGGHKSSRMSIIADEFVTKAQTDPQLLTPFTAGQGFFTDYDRNVVIGKRIQPVISDLLGAGTLDGNTISYMVEGAREGSYTNVAEGAQFSQLHFADPDVVTETLRIIAGFIKLSTVMMEDAAFLVSEIDNRLMYELQIYEEQNQLLNGDGSGQNVLGLLQRTGIQTETAADADDVFAAVHRCMTKIQTLTNVLPDGIVMHPLDYESLRLSRDANGQFYGGGPFLGQYGNDSGLPAQPNVWSLRTVVTPLIAKGTSLVGSFSAAATLYRKGGVRVESTNSDQGDFTRGLVAVRAMERIALAVRIPLAFVKLTWPTP